MEFCPICKIILEWDRKTGPGKWYWCKNCLDYTIYTEARTGQLVERKMEKTNSPLDCK